MKGQLFVHFLPDQNIKGRINVKTGVVQQELANGHYLLRFDGKTFRASNVFSTDKLQAFAFFETDEERTQFINELLAANQPVTSDPQILDLPPAG
jgi:hypothetical protein